MSFSNRILLIMSKNCIQLRDCPDTPVGVAFLSTLVMSSSFWMFMDVTFLGPGHVTILVSSSLMESS